MKIPYGTEVAFYHGICKKLFQKGACNFILTHCYRTILVPLAVLLLLSLSACGGADSSASTGSSSITLSWMAPSTNADGTSLTDLQGYKVYYGKQATYYYSYSIDVGNAVSARVPNLSPGKWCFAVTAYDVSGNESEYSQSVCTEIS
jgi:hypothetical protein